MNYKFKKLYYKCRKVLFRNDETISYEEAVELYDKGQAIIIDVRTPEEFSQSHVQGAINIPVNEIVERIKDVEKNKNKVIIVYCKTGKRSKIAKKLLEEEGYNNIYILYI